MKINKLSIKSLSWSITTRCNYNCDYCLAAGRNLSDSNYFDPYLFLDKFKKNLKGSWNFYICGSGEPFLTPRFLDIIKELVDMDHRIIVITNFSSSLETLKRFCQITGKNLGHLAASFHPDFENVDTFFRKAVVINKIIGGRFSVRTVAVEGKILQLAEIGKRFKENNIKFYLKKKRIKKTDTQKTVKYSKKELRLIREFSFHNTPKFSRYNYFKGKKCWAGSRYFVIDEKGETWRCYPAAQSRLPNGYLGNLIKGTFELKQRQSKCSYDNCYCAQPILYKFMEFKKNQN